MGRGAAVMGGDVGGRYSFAFFYAGGVIGGGTFHTREFEHFRLFRLFVDMFFK